MVFTYLGILALVSIKLCLTTHKHIFTYLRLQEGKKDFKVEIK